MPILCPQGQPGGLSTCDRFWRWRRHAVGLVATPAVARPFPACCPPFCDAIPDSAWIAPAALPAVSGVSLAGPRRAGRHRSPRPGSQFEEACATPSPLGDSRDYAVAARLSVPNPAGQWHLLVQVMHWRGDTVTGGRAASGVAGDRQGRADPLPRHRAFDLTVDHHRRGAAARGRDQRAGRRVMHSTCSPTRQ